MQTVNTSSLEFTGELPAWLVVGLALMLAALMAWWYRKEMVRQGVPAVAAWVLPSLRSLAVFLVFLTLAAPVLRHVSVSRQWQKVVLIVDGSQSMQLGDEVDDEWQESRWERLNRLLLSGPEALVHLLSRSHDVELVGLRGQEVQRIWWQRERGTAKTGVPPAQLPFSADGKVTDLGATLRKALEPMDQGTAVVLFSDGRHNGGGAPEGLAASLGAAGGKIFAVGMGSEQMPPDLAISRIELPETVFESEMVRGKVVFHDTMPAGLDVRVRIEAAGESLWEKKVMSDGSGQRELAFEFPVERMKSGALGAGQSHELTAWIFADGAKEGWDRVQINNRMKVRMQVVERRRNALVLDGRPRWESRYVASHFERDDRWDVKVGYDDLIAAPGQGNGARAFPQSREELYRYDLVVIGDLKPDCLRSDQRQWLVEFVEKKGGGLIFVDGQRGHLKEWLGETEVAGLLPISWEEEKEERRGPWQWGLAQGVVATPSLLFEESVAANAVLWQRLPPAQWVAPVREAPGAEVVATLKSPGGEIQPAMVFRPYGAGAVLYLASDELWRWRYEVADLYHQRLWMQLASWIAAPPFQANSSRISLGMDRLSYQTNERGEVRVRLRNAAGSLIVEAKPQVLLLDEGRVRAVISLELDSGHVGTFRGVTPPLKGGSFELAVVSQPGESPDDLRLAFQVGDPGDSEMASLTMNRDLLTAMANATGGAFLREQEVGDLPSLLQREDRKQTQIKETLIWSSWWWLLPILGLLVIEWFLRRSLQLI